MKYLIGLAIVISSLFSSCSDPAKARLAFQHPKSNPTQIVARIGEDTVTQSDLGIDSQLEIYELEKKLYALKRVQLLKYLTKKTYSENAKKQGLPLEDYVDKKIIGSSSKVTQREIDAFLKSRDIKKEDLNSVLSEKIEAHLIEQKKQLAIEAALAKSLKGKTIEVTFERPQITLNIPLEGSPGMGEKNAPLTIVEFSDFQCPYCQKATQTIKEVLKKYKSKIRLVYKHLPLPFHKQAKEAAEASMCVFDQNEASFWKFHDLAFEHQNELTAPSLRSYAEKSGANLDLYDQCVETKKMLQTVERDIELATNLGLRSTPTFVIGSDVLMGSQDYEAFEKMIEQNLPEQK